MPEDTEQYEGKRIKIRGMFRPYSDCDEDGNKYWYCGCIVPDAAGCCYQSIDFDCPKGMTDPGDFPEFEQEVIVTGTFHKGEDENGYQTVRLINTSLEIAE